MNILITATTKNLIKFDNFIFETAFAYEYEFTVKNRDTIQVKGDKTDLTYLKKIFALEGIRVKISAAN